MTLLADIAASILAQQGETVSYLVPSDDPDAEAVEVQAVVTRHGLGPCPIGWPADLFPGMARHAAFRIPGEDESGNPVAEPQLGDGVGFAISCGGLVYRVRAVAREPITGPNVLWWVLFGACSQRGKY